MIPCRKCPASLPASTASGAGFKEDISVKEIFERRSVRSFIEKDVEAEKVGRLLRSAMQAPTGGDQREWHFVVVKDRSQREELGRCSPYAESVRSAPVVIVPCADMALCRFRELWEQDLASSTENILLEAVHLGLGAVWQAIAPLEEREEAVKKVLHLPENVRPFALISVGYPAKVPVKEDRFDRTRIHEERW